jgi:hypothetical protein
VIVAKSVTEMWNVYRSAFAARCPARRADAEGRAVLDEKNVLVTTDGLEVPSGQAVVEVGGALKNPSKHEDDPGNTSPLWATPADGFPAGGAEKQRRPLIVQAADVRLATAALAQIDSRAEPLHPLDGGPEVGHREAESHARLLVIVGEYKLNRGDRAHFGGARGASPRRGSHHVV